MADLGLTYTQIKSYEGTYSYQLEPDLDLLAKFPGKKEKNRSNFLKLIITCLFIGFDGVTVSHFGRQLLTREIELECIHRAVPKIEENLNPPTEKISKGAKLNDVKNSRIPNHLQRLVPKLCTSNDINSKDMKVKPAPVYINILQVLNFCYSHIHELNLYCIPSFIIDSSFCLSKQIMVYRNQFCLALFRIVSVHGSVGLNFMHW